MAAKYIDIRTGQNVLLSYELAPVQYRILSNLIDNAILLSALTVLIDNFFATLVYPSVILQYSTIVWLYHLIVLIAMDSRSIGMRIIGLRIISMQGNKIDFFTYFLRWILRPIDITVSAGAIAIISIVGSTNKQRLGDIFAGTVVILFRNNSNFLLKEITEFHDNKTPTKVKYIDVKKLDENDVLLLKNLLNNTEHYPIGIRRKAINRAANKLRMLLELEKDDMENEAFLRQIIDDYIQITR